MHAFTEQRPPPRRWREMAARWSLRSRPGARKWLRRLGIAVACVLALWVVLWLAMPPLLKWQGQQRLTEKLGRPVTIGSVDFRPWSLEVALRDLTIGGP